MLSRVGLFVCVLMLVVVPAASAAQRFAAPGGGPTDCKEVNPCGVEKAVEGAGPGDEVIVAAGNYDLGNTSVHTEIDGLAVHGVAGAPAPTITTTGTEPGPTLELSGTDASISHLNLVRHGSGGTAAVCGAGGRVDGIHATSTGAEGSAIEMFHSCVVRDSVAVSRGDGAVAIFANPVSDARAMALRNVTAIAPGTDGVGIRGYSFNISEDPASLVLDIKNAIASGAALDLEASGLSGPTQLKVANSNFDTSKTTGSGDSVVDGGGNQTAAALFVDANAGDFREAAGSPTIDAGAGDPGLGAQAVDGEARTIGPAPDIGAYETTRPAPVIATLDSLSIAPKAFVAANVGGATLSKVKKKKPAKVGATVSYSLAAAGSVAFSVEKVVPGRKAGKKCVKQSKANKTKKKCKLYKPVKGSFTQNGAAGANSFKFSGRVSDKSLRPGAYRLVGQAGGVVKSAPFTIVK